MQKSRGLEAFPVAVLTLFVSFTLLAECAIPAAAQRAPVIAAIDDSQRVTLQRTTHPLAQKKFEIGSPDAGQRMERMLLVLGPNDAVQPDLRALIDSQHDKKSSSYHKWITPEEFGERFGPSQQDVEAITNWLQQKGFDSIKSSRGKGTIEFSGPVQIVEQAFGTQMRYYQANGETHLANSADISIPSAMSGIVRGVNLQNFNFSKPSLTGMEVVGRDDTGKFARVSPAATTGGGSHFLAPGDYAKIYDINPLYKNNINGAGASIALVARSNIELADVQTFRQAFNLPPNDPEIVLNGQDPGATLSLDLFEASLDTQWSGALAPGATVKVVVSQSTPTTDGVFLSEVYIVDNNLADIMSVSFHACEQLFAPSDVAFFSGLYQQAAAEGISVFVSSGDAGAADCEFTGFNGGPATTGLAVNGLASTPFDTAVGGTEFNENGNDSTFWSATNSSGFVSAFGYIPEMVWNESCDPTVNPNCFAGLFNFAAGGGGVSTLYSKPSWQSTSITGVPNDNARDVPDVSLTAAGHDGYIFCLTLFSPCVVEGSGGQAQLASAGIIAGTSASVQAFASIMALIDQQQGGRQGLANYVLYKLASKEAFANCNSSNRTDPTQPAPAACVFNDTTVGNNGIPGNDTLSGPVPPGDVDGQVGYNATPGYDSASGLGSVDVTNLARNWGSVTFRGSKTTLATSASASAQHGQPITFDLNVGSVSGAGTPSGAFVLIAKNAPAVFNNTAVGSGTLTNGRFTGPINTLPGGEYQVIAHYGGDGTFGGSDSNVVAVNVSREHSSVAISGKDQNGNPFSAPGSLDLGYGLNQPILVTVSTASGTGSPTGTVSLFDGAAQIAKLPLNNNGQATFINCDPFSAPFCLSKSTHNLTAVYSGDSSSANATSPVLTVNVTRGTVVFGVFTGCCPGNQTTEIEADFSTGSAVLATPPTGMVTFSATPSGSSSPIPLGFPASLSQEGLILFRWFELPPSTYNFNTTYSGDDNYLPQTATSAPVQVSQGTVGPNNSPVGTVPTETVVTATTNPIVEGQPVTFQVTVSSTASPTTPTGNIQILAGASFVGPGGNLVNGTATVQGIMPNANTSVQALYSGDTTFSPSTSAPLEIAPQKIAATMNLSADATNVPAGTQVSLLATLSGPAGSLAPQGTLQFFDSVNGGPAKPIEADRLLLPSASGDSFNLSTASISLVLPAGTNTITAFYSGDTNYNSIQQPDSTPVAVVVNPGPIALFSFATLPGGNAVTINKKQTARFRVFLNANGFAGQAALNCSGAPAGMTCAVNPASVDLTKTVTSVPLVVTVAPDTGHGATIRGNQRHFTLTLTGTHGSKSSSIPLMLTVNP